jgi:DNA-binding LytR/AlgR family response regulator
MKPQLTSQIPVINHFNVGEKLKSQFPYYLNDEKKNLLMILGISVFVIFFMSVYRPYGNFEEHLSFAAVCIFGIVTFVILSISVVLLPRIFPVVFDPVTWTLQKYLTQTLLQCFVIGLASIWVDRLLFICPHKNLFEVAIHAYTQVALIGIIPVTFITLFLKNNMLQQNLLEAIKTNHELERIRDLKNEINKPVSHAITIYSDTSETLNLNLPDLLFVEADDNYSTVYWQDQNNGVQKKLLRINLKNMESQIDNTFTLRCHRSYIVNVHAISSITGNTNGYKLRIKDTDHFIPVSRPKGKEVMEKIKQLKNMMELY